MARISRTFSGHGDDEIFDKVHEVMERIADEFSLDYRQDGKLRQGEVSKMGITGKFAVKASEVVVDYALRLKRELTDQPGPAIWVAGYSNLYDDYVASRRILEEGGYEAKNTPWKPSLEERIIGKAHELYARTKNPPSSAPKAGPASPVQVKSSP